MAKYTMELRALIEAGYNIFDDSWTTFIPEHKAELCDKIIRRYYFNEIGAETPDRFKHYLNEQLARIMPRMNKLYETELMSIYPLYNYIMEEEGTADSDRGLNRLKSSRIDRHALQEMGSSLFKVLNTTENVIGSMKDNKTNSWEEHTTGDEDGTLKRTINETMDEDGSLKRDIDEKQDKSFTDHSDTEGTSTNTATDEITGHKDTKDNTKSTSSASKRYADTPQASISATEMDIMKSYLTNYTADNGSTTSDSTGSEDIKNSETKTEIGSTTGKSDGTHVEDNTITTGQTDATTTDRETNTTQNDTTHRDYSEDKHGGAEDNEKEDTTEDTTREEQGKQFNQTKGSEFGSETGAENEGIKEQKKDITKIKSFGSTVSQATLIKEYRDSIINVDEIIIEAVKENFMGVF